MPAGLLLKTIGPVCAAVSACTGICAAELTVLQNVLGDNVAVERTDQIPTGRGGMPIACPRARTRDFRTGGRYN